MFISFFVRKFLLFGFLTAFTILVIPNAASAAALTTSTKTISARLMSTKLISAKLLDYSSASASQAAIYYVSKEGNNGNGQSWQTAWNELDQINWPIIKPGDTIVIDGGAIEMTYATPMEIGASGSSDAPIYIQASAEPGRNGKITIFGGRYKALPHCFQNSFEDPIGEIINFGIRTNDHSWLILDGLDWNGIVIHGFGRAGIRIDRHSKNITVRNVEIYNNGYAKSTSRGWVPEGVGIRLAGPYMVVERALIHDNGQDAIQSMWDDNNIHNFRISNSWLYNGRRHLTVDESWNYCTHTDGLQIYDGGLISGITIENSVVGPGFTNGLILGQTPADNGAQADVHDVTIRNTILTKAADNGLFGYEGSNTQNWKLDHVTMHCPKTKWHCITLDNATHSVTNSILVGSRLTFEDGLNHYENNCIWKTAGLEIGQNRNPQFTKISDSDHFSLDDYTLKSSSPCQGKGSSITSVNALLGTKDVPLLPNPNLPPGQLPPGDSTPPSAILPPPSSPGETVIPSEPNESTGSLLNAESMAAVDGEISVEFSIDNGALFQTIDVGSAMDGGLATYRFFVGETGFYEIEAIIRAESESYNSLFINMDSDPTIDYMIWDIPVTVGFEARTVAWRGNGTFDQSEFKPKYFHLTAGEHTLYVRGRESYTYLEQFSVRAATDDVNTPVLRPQVELTPIIYLPLVAEQ